jgi:hypothetical protein
LSFKIKAPIHAKPKRNLDWNLKNKIHEYNVVL